MRLYDRMTKAEALRMGASQFIATRWVDVQKEDKVRSRLVAKEIARTQRGDLSSPTPSLE